MMRSDLAIAAIIWVGVLTAQDGGWQASVPNVPVPGLYAIVLGPELMGRSRSDLGDVRLIDPDGEEVPYVLRTPAMPLTRTHFIPYAVLRNEVLPYRTEIELERHPDDEMDDLHIRVRPAEVQKHVRITGSDNGINWYMVKDEHLVSQGARGDPPHQVLMVNVPRSDYRYYRITMNDSLTPPMQVLDVGRYLQEQVPVRRTSTRSLSWVQDDSSGTTRLHIWSIHPMAIDRVGFSIEGDLPFQRSGMVIFWSNVQAGRTSRKRSHRLDKIHSSFTISSDRPFRIDMPGLRADTFMLVIDNGDNRPLQFRSVNASVVEHVLLAHLAPGSGYRLITGNSSLAPPHYDMVHFMDELPLPIDTLEHQGLMAMPRMGQGLPAFDPEAWWVWAIIIPLIGGMAYMAVRMLRQEGQGDMP